MLIETCSSPHSLWSVGSGHELACAWGFLRCEWEALLGPFMETLKNETNDGAYICSLMER